jgi:hypothetical protein
MIIFVQLFGLGAQIQTLNPLYWWLIGSVAVISLNGFLLINHGVISRQPQFTTLLLLAFISILCHVSNEIVQVIRMFDHSFD